MTPARRLGWIAACLVALLLVSRTCLALPEPAGPVSDFANILSEATEQQLLTMIRGLEADTTAEVAVVTVQSLDGMTVEDYAHTLFTTWGIGRKQVDNGVLILVAVADRKMRIEVGYGLEGILPDGLAGEIIRKQFTPRFKEGDYDGGILAGTTRVVDIVRTRHVLTDEEKLALEDDAQGAVWVLVPFLGVFVVIGFLGLGAGLRNKVFVPSFFGLFFGGGRGNCEAARRRRPRVHRGRGRLTRSVE